MPESLDIESSSWGDEGMKYLLHLAGNSIERVMSQNERYVQCMENAKVENPERFKRSIEIGKAYLHNIADYGAKNWYEWRINNWGTKWNAYNISKIGENTVQFDTAWNGVPELIMFLAEKFPDVTMDYIYADENYGYNVGRYYLHGKDVDDLTPDDDTHDAWQIVFEIGLVDPDEMVEQPDGTYKWKEEDDD